MEQTQAAAVSGGGQQSAQPESEMRVRQASELSNGRAVEAGIPGPEEVPNLVDRDAVSREFQLFHDFLVLLGGKGLLRARS